MYTRYARRNNLDFISLDERWESGQLRFALIEITGKGASNLLQEAGGHSIQHITKSRSKDRIHTSTATVAVFPLQKKAEKEISLKDIRIDTFRGSGKGGQHRNVTDSAVRATYIPTGEMATVTSGRSQIENRKQALSVLVSRISAQDKSNRLKHQQKERTRQTQAEKAKAIRVYDLIQGMVRSPYKNSKVRQPEKVLDGQLELVWKS